MPLVQQGSTLNTGTGTSAGFTTDFYNELLADGSIALNYANGSGVPSLRFINAAGELIREMQTPGFNTVRDMVALPDGGLMLIGFPNAGVANGGIVAQVINADGTFRTPNPVTITTNTQAGVGGGVAADMRAVLLPTGEVYVAWQSDKDFSLAFNPLVTRFTPPGAAGTTVGSAAAGFDIYAGKVNPSALTNIGQSTLIHAGVESGPDYQVADRRAGAQLLADIDVMADGDVLITYLGDRYTYNGAAVRMANYVEINPHTNAIVVPQRAVSDNPIIGTQSFQNTEYQFAKSVMLGPKEIGSFAAQFLPSLPSFTLSGQMLKSQPNTGFANIGSFVDIGLNFSSGSPIAGFEPLPHGANDFVAAYTFYNTATANHDIKIRHYNASGVVQSEIDVANGPTDEWMLGFSKGEDNSYIATYRLQSGERITKRYVVTETGGVQSVTDGAGSTLINLSSANDWGAGEAGNDTINGLGGDDNLFGGAGLDQLVGGDGQDQLYGGAHADILFGGNQNDTLDGGTGDDNLYGGAGADSHVGGAGFDIARYDDAWGVQVDILFSNAFGSLAAGDRFSGIEGVSGSNTDDGVWGTDENNTIFTWLGNDYIDGRGGVDVLLGGANNDTLVGGAGGDYLAGEAGADVFRYIALTDSGPSAQDYLPDFSSAQGDKIDVSAFAGTATFNSGFGTGTSVYAFSQGGGAWTLVQFYQGSTLHLQIVVNAPSLSAGDFIL